jgi:CxxC motif-containing protein (DUF1111 family)
MHTVARRSRRTRGPAIIGTVVTALALVVPAAVHAQTNLALNKPVTASANPQYAATNAVDGNVGTRWSSAQGVDPQWIYVDLGAATSIGKVILRWEAAFAKAYQIQTSPDAATWTSIYSTTTGPGGTETLAVSGTGRYVRLYGTVRATIYGYSLWEFEIYAPTGATATSTATATATARPTATATTRATATATTRATFTATATATATATPTARGTATPTATVGSVVSLFDGGTALEPDMIVDTPTALITRWGDRSRDRHAREANFASYDHYLPLYFQYRTHQIEMIDHVAKGQPGGITINITSLWTINLKDVRLFYSGVGGENLYYANFQAAKIDDHHYTATINYNNPKTNAPMAIGDRMEIEISLFLNADVPGGGRTNYYGTAYLYKIGQGIVPWYKFDPNYHPDTDANAPVLNDSWPIDPTGWLGGKTTIGYNYSAEPQHRFKQMATNMSWANVQPFVLGRRYHHTDFGDGTHSETGNPVFTEQIGKLGPRFVARSCVGCHTNNGRALPPATTGTTLTQYAVKVGSDANGSSHPNLGKVLQSQSTSGAAEATVNIGSWATTPGTYGDGSAYSLRKPSYAFTGVTPAFYSPRIAAQLAGMGLLEAVSESTINALADPNDNNGDGISGRMQVVTDPETGQPRMGRFGWKAGAARIKHQIAGALSNDMGVQTSVFPNPDCGSAQTCSAAGSELADSDLDEWVRYIATLGVTARRDLSDATALHGESLFTSIGCTKCHVATLVTSPFHPFWELRNQTIHPYTDLLLHDMGTGLADNMGEGLATGAEWRTPPLWNIGLTAGVSGGEAYLHDGRARTLEEAILWHGGEGNTAKEAFRTLSAGDRAALIAFLRSL